MVSKKMQEEFDYSYAGIRVEGGEVEFPPYPTKETVNHPDHYTSHPSGIECIQITEHMPFLLGNVFKYVWRADMKNGLEDLKKAKWYLEREIQRREEK